MAADRGGIGELIEDASRVLTSAATLRSVDSLRCTVGAPGVFCWVWAFATFEQGFEAFALGGIELGGDAFAEFADLGLDAGDNRLPIRADTLFALADEAADAVALFGGELDLVLEPAKGFEALPSGRLAEDTFSAAVAG